MKPPSGVQVTFRFGQENDINHFLSNCQYTFPYHDFIQGKIFQLKV